MPAQTLAVPNHIITALAGSGGAPLWWYAIPSPLIAASAALLGVLVGSGISAWTTRSTHRERITADQALTERRVEADIALADRKVELEFGLAERKFVLDRALADWKRKTELAEQILADFYKARDIFMAARSAFSWNGEGATRQAREGETQDETRRFNALYAPFERLSKERDFLSELNARRFRFMALFGNQSGAPFLVFVQTYNEIRNATQELIDDDPHLGNEWKSKYRAQIWARSTENDPIKQQLDEAVAAIEATCQPAIAVGPS
jgi:hypothetical protein